MSVKQKTNKSLIVSYHMVWASLLVKVLCVFPKLGDLLFRVYHEYEEELMRRAYNKHSESIDDWMRTDDQTK